MKTRDFLLAHCAGGWRNLALWSACIAILVVLGAVRTMTDAEYAFASASMLPILAVAWFGSQRQGMVAAILAAAMWVAADLAAGRQFGADWVPWVNAATRLLTYCLMAFLAAQVRHSLELERERATHDALTGLANRRRFLEDGQREVERSRRYSRPMAVAFLDLDNFKQLNDRMGHGAGDRALRETASALEKSIRTTDRAGRIGGDEFAILLPEIGYEEALVAGGKIVAAVRKQLERYPPATASAGVVWISTADRPFLEILRTADELMYEAKSAGGDAVQSRRIDAGTPADTHLRRDGR